MNDQIQYNYSLLCILFWISHCKNRLKVDFSQYNRFCNFFTMLVFVKYGWIGFNKYKIKQNVDRHLKNIAIFMFIDACYMMKLETFIFFCIFCCASTHYLWLSSLKQTSNDMCQNLCHLTNLIFQDGLWIDLNTT